MVLAGLALMAVGLALLAQLPAEGRYATDLLPGIVVLAGGFGVAMPALTGLAMADATPADSGVASGLFGTTQQVGGALGAPVEAAHACAPTVTPPRSGAGRPASSSHRTAIRTTTPAATRRGRSTPERRRRGGARSRGDVGRRRGR